MPAIPDRDSGWRARFVLLGKLYSGRFFLLKSNWKKFIANVLWVCNGLECIYRWTTWFFFGILGKFRVFPTNLGYSKKSGKYEEFVFQAFSTSFPWILSWTCSNESRHRPILSSTRKPGIPSLDISHQISNFRAFVVRSGNSSQYKAYFVTSKTSHQPHDPDNLQCFMFAVTERRSRNDSQNTPSIELQTNNPKSISASFHRLQQIKWALVLLLLVLLFCFVFLLLF